MSARGQRLYRRLLRVLPRSFRDRHAREIEEALAADAADETGRGGSGMRFWAGALLDLLGGALRERGRTVQEDARQDLRYAARTLWHAPAFTLLAVGALALGMGANTAVFTLVNEIALRPLPVHRPDRLVKILVDRPGGNSFGGFSYPEYRDYRDRNRVLAGLAASHARPMTVGPEGPDAMAQLVSANFLDLLGVAPVRGRMFSEEELRRGAAVVVTSFGLWQRRGGGADFVGSPLLLDGIPVTVIGVLPEGFTGLFIGFPSDLFLPVTLLDRIRPGTELASRGEFMLELFGRLRDGVTVAEADRGLDAIAVELEREFPAINADRRVYVHSFTGIDDSLQAGVTSLVVVLLVLAALVLLTACLNVGGLLLARGQRRHREIAIRSAIGASRARVVRQLVSETLVLFALGAAAALLFAVQINALLRRFVDSLPVPLGFDLAMDGRVLAFSGTVALATALMTGIVPALRASQHRPGSAAGRHGGADSPRIRNVFLVAQVAASVVLLVSAGLFLRAIQEGQRLDPGFEIEGLAMAGFGLPADEYDAAGAYEFYAALRDDMRAADPTAAIGIASLPPIGVAHTPMPIGVPGFEPPPGEAAVAVDANAVGAGYFEALRVPLIEGRTFERRDEDAAQTMEGRHVAVINRAMAQRFWPDASAVGRVVFDGDTEIHVVGVVDDTRHVMQDAEAAPLMYLLAAQRPRHRMMLLVRSSAPLSRLNEELRAAVDELDASIVAPRLESADTTLTFFFLPQRAAAQLIAALGLLALLLAVAGVYGIVSYAVSCRRRELGIRVALGGAPGEQVVLVMKNALLLVGLGLLVGGIGVVAVAPVLRGFLFGLPIFDLGAVIGIAAALLSTALIAAWVPARRVLKLEAVEVLRGD